jgi:hypothetical protein
MPNGLPMRPPLATQSAVLLDEHRDHLHLRHGEAACPLYEGIFYIRHAAPNTELGDLTAAYVVLGISMLIEG